MSLPWDNRRRWIAIPPSVAAYQARQTWSSTLSQHATYDQSETSRSKVYAIAGFEKSKKIREEYSKNLRCGGNNGVRKQNVFVWPIFQSLKTVVDDRRAEQVKSRKRRIKPMETDSVTDQANDGDYSTPVVNQNKNDQVQVKKQKNQPDPAVAVAEHSNQSLRFDDGQRIFSLLLFLKT